MQKPTWDARQNDPSLLTKCCVAGTRMLHPHLCMPMPMASTTHELIEAQYALVRPTLPSGSLPCIP
eukprot:4550611-Karenia_brevis.AAC.1